MYSEVVFVPLCHFLVSFDLKPLHHGVRNISCHSLGDGMFVESYIRKKTHSKSMLKTWAYRKLVECC